MSVNNHCYTSRWTVRVFESIVGEWHLTLASHVHQSSTGVLEDSTLGLVSFRHARWVIDILNRQTRVAMEYDELRSKHDYYVQYVLLKLDRRQALKETGENRIQNLRDATFT